MPARAYAPLLGAINAASAQSPAGTQRSTIVVHSVCHFINTVTYSSASNIDPIGCGERSEPHQSRKDLEELYLAAKQYISFFWGRVRETTCSKKGLPGELLPKGPPYGQRTVLIGWHSRQLFVESSVILIGYLPVKHAEQKSFSGNGIALNIPSRLK